MFVSINTVAQIFSCHFDLLLHDFLLSVEGLIYLEPQKPIIYVFPYFDASKFA